MWRDYVKIKYLSFGFIGIFVFISCISTARAESKCSLGCFCLSDNGQNTTDTMCASSAKKLENSGKLALRVCDAMIVSDDYDVSTIDPTIKERHEKIYHVSDFTEIYDSTAHYSTTYVYHGAYGFTKDGRFVYFRDVDCTNNKLNYLCPETYPNSDEGAKALTDCFTYDASGQKQYYKALESTSITSDLSDWAIDHSSILTLDWSKDHQLTQLFDSNTTYNGWVAGIVCQPGYYMPANTTRCASCPSDKNCPGGMFYVDKTYNVDRGIISGGSTTPSTTNTSSTTTTGGGNAANSSSASLTGSQTDVSSGTTQTPKTIKDKSKLKVLTKKDLEQLSINPELAKSAIKINSRGVVTNSDNTSRAQTNHRAARTVTQAPISTSSPRDNSRNIKRSAL